jgi:hypothetical protein
MTPVINDRIYLDNAATTPLDPEKASASRAGVPAVRARVRM